MQVSTRRTGPLSSSAGARPEPKPARRREGTGPGPQPQPMTTRDENQSSTSLTHLQEAGNYSEHSSVCACARQRLFAHALCTLLRFGRSYMQGGQSGCGGVALPIEVHTRACAPGVWRSQVVGQILLLPKPNSHSMPNCVRVGHLLGI